MTRRPPRRWAVCTAAALGLSALPLFAEPSAPRVDLREVSRYAMEGATMPWPELLIAAGLIVVLLSALALFHRLRRGPLEPHPLQHFDRAARTLGLTMSQRLLLVRIARKLKLESPLTLLACSGALHQLGRQYAAGLPVERRKRVFRALSAIQRRVFLAEEAFEETVGDPRPGDTEPDPASALRGEPEGPDRDKPYALPGGHEVPAAQGSAHAH